MKGRILGIAGWLYVLAIITINAKDFGERSLSGSVCGTQNATTNNYKESLDKMLLSWRMLPGDDASTAFDLYRSIAGGKEVKLNSAPIYATNYQDLTLTFGGRGDTGEVLTD